MGSFNTTCAITGLPLKGKAILLLTTKSNHSRFISDRQHLLGIPVTAQYSDYGDFQVDRDIFNDSSVLAADLDNQEGVYILDQQWLSDIAEHKRLRQTDVLALDLWMMGNNLLHVLHDLVLLKVSWAISQMNFKYGTNFKSFTDIEKSERSEGLAATNKKAWKYYTELLAQMPSSYDDRAKLIHNWLDKGEVNDSSSLISRLIDILHQNSKTQCTDNCTESGSGLKTQSKEKLLAKIVELFKTTCLLSDMPQSSGIDQQIRTVLKTRLFETISIHAVYPEAYQQMVQCVQRQISTDLAQNLKDYSVKPKTDFDLDEKNFEDQPPKIRKLLISMAKGAFKPKGFLALDAFCGRQASEEDIEIVKEAALFAELFKHGFVLQTPEFTQYEGVSYKADQAQAVLSVYSYIKKDLYNGGKMEISAI